MPQKNETPAGKAGARGDFIGNRSPEILSNVATARQFDTPRGAALFLLNGGYRLTRKAGSFLGQLVVDQSELTEKQADWLDKLLSKRGLPCVKRGASHD